MRDQPVLDEDWSEGLDVITQPADHCCQGGGKVCQHWESQRDADDGENNAEGSEHYTSVFIIHNPKSPPPGRGVGCDVPIADGGDDGGGEEHWLEEVPALSYVPVSLDSSSRGLAREFDYEG